MKHSNAAVHVLGSKQTGPHMCVPDHTNLDLAPTVSFPYLLLSDDCDHILSQERQDTDHAFVDGVFSLGDTGDHGARRHGHHSI